MSPKDQFPYAPPATPNEFISLLSDYIVHLNQIDISTPAELASRLRKHKLVILDSFIDPSGHEGIKGYKRYDLPPTSLDNDLKNIKFFREGDGGMIEAGIISAGTMSGKAIGLEFSKKDYNRDFIDDISNQYVNYILIDQVDALNKEYKYRMDCCRVDIRDMMRSQNIGSGVAINASFFNLKEDFKPMGYFRTKDVIIDNPIPSMYKKYYGMVGINKNGLLEINAYLPADQANGIYDQVISAGPVLVWKKKILMTEDVMRFVDDGISVLQCRSAKNSDKDKDSKYFADGIPNCSKIDPGELSHSSNVNPRTAIGIRGDQVIFVYVEGRNQRGAGMDLVMLARYMAEVIKADVAINLDGGRSSQMMWKTVGSDHITQMNPKHNYTYPV